MFSFKKWATTASAACLLLSLSVAPLFSQAAAEQKQSVEGFVASIRQAKINPERDAYMALYNEQDASQEDRTGREVFDRLPGNRT